MKRESNIVVEECVRGGVSIIKTQAELKEPHIESTPQPPTFLIKMFPGADIISVDKGCYLMRQVNVIGGGAWELGDGELELNSFPDDLLGEVSVDEVLAPGYGERATIYMKPGEFVVDVDPESVLPYLFTKWDH